MSDKPLNWYPQPTGDYETDFALRTAFDNLYQLRDKMNAATATIPAPAPSFADISKALTGSAPTALNVTGLPGTLSQPQPAKIPQYSPLPPASSAVDGQLGWYGGVTYRFDAATGQWVPIAGTFRYGTRRQRQDHLAFPLNDPTILPPGTPYFETDTGLTYIVIPDPFLGPVHPNQWFFQGGQANMFWANRNAPGTEWPGSNALWDYTDVNAKLIVSDDNPGQSANGTLQYEVQVTTFINPADPTTWIVNPYFDNGIYQLGAASPGAPGPSPLQLYDKGYVVFASTVGHSWRWTGTGWEFANGGEGAGGCVAGPVAPNPGIGWFQQVPVAGGVIAISASNGGVTNFTYTAYTAFNTSNPGWFYWARL